MFTFGFCNVKHNLIVLSFLLFFTILTSVLIVIVENLSSQIRDFWLPKVMSGAFWDLMSSDGIFHNDEYCIFSTTQFADSNAGGDFYRAEIRGDSIVLIVGDVISHGIAVSQGAVVALSAFKAINSDDPKLILEAINRALLPIQRDHGGETLAFCIKIENSGVCTYNGSIEKLIHLDANLNEILEIKTHGTILGKLDSKIEENSILKIGVGDNLILLTDGAANNDDDDDKTSIVISKGKLTDEQ